MAKLGAKYPSSGGLITFLMGYGRGHTTSITSWLLYFASLIVTAMVSVSFGSYATALLVKDADPGAWDNILTTALVVAVAVVNIAGAVHRPRAERHRDRAPGRLRRLHRRHLTQINPELLAPSTYPERSAIVSSVALTFFAYLGFAVITFTGGDLPDPDRNLPRAMYRPWASRPSSTS